jgi:hypothetical protein
MTAHIFPLVAFGIAVTATAAMTVMSSADHSWETLARWGFLYVVSVVAPVGWSLHHLRTRPGIDSRFLAAPAYVGMLALVASLPLIRGGVSGDRLTLAIWTASALGIALLVRSTRRHTQPR